MRSRPSQALLLHSDTSPTGRAGRPCASTYPQAMHLRLPSTETDRLTRGRSSRAAASKSRTPMTDDSGAAHSSASGPDTRRLRQLHRVEAAGRSSVSPRPVFGNRYGVPSGTGHTFTLRNTTNRKSGLCGYVFLVTLQFPPTWVTYINNHISNIK